MCIAYIKRDKQCCKWEIKENKGSCHVNQWFWGILQKFRGFKLICKHYFMHKVKKSKYYNKNKSTQLPGLNKQHSLLGKINPKCVLSYIYPALGLKTTQIGLFLTECFLERKRGRECMKWDVNEGGWVGLGQLTSRFFYHFSGQMLASQLRGEGWQPAFRGEHPSCSSMSITLVSNEQNNATSMKHSYSMCWEKSSAFNRNVQNDIFKTSWFAQVLIKLVSTNK